MEIRIDEKKVRHKMLENDIESLTQVATAAGLSVNTVSKVIRGKGWTNSTLEGLACALRCSPFDILVVNADPHM